MATESLLAGQPQTPAPPALVRTPLRRLWQVPLFLAGLAALGGVWLTQPLWYDPQAWRLEQVFAEARQALEDPTAAVDAVPRLMAEVLQYPGRLPARMGEAHFLLGSAHVRLASQAPAEKTTDLWREARSHLELANELGVPDADHSRLLHRLGLAWYHTGCDPARVIDYLTRSLEDADSRFDAFGILTQAYLRLPTANVQAALDANERQLQLPNTDEARLAPVRLLRGELLLGMQERDAARKVLARLGSGAPPATLSRARHLRAQSYQEDEAWADAAAIWQEILAEEPAAPDRGRIFYALGICCRNLQRPVEAGRAWEQAQLLGGDEGQAATIHLAEQRVQSAQFEAAVEMYETALRTVARPADYHNRLIDLAQVRGLIESGCRACSQGGSLPSARRLADLAARLAPTSSANDLVAQVEEAWAQAETARHQVESGHSHYENAGKAFEAAAAAAGDLDGRVRWLWRAGDAYVHAEAHALAIGVLEKFVKLQPPIERMGEAWYRLGLAYRAMNQNQKAGTAFNQCIAYPGPFAFRARYELAMADAARNELVQAISALQQNLQLLSNEPDREAHEKSLYALAELLFKHLDYDLARQRWEQALTLYPTNPDNLTARQGLGEAYRKLADAELVGLQLQPGDRYGPTTRLNYQKRRTSLLEGAAANFQKLADDLETRHGAGTLTRGQEGLLATAQFARAKCQQDLGNFDEAIRLYEELVQRYKHQVEELVALRELYACYVNLVPPDKTSAQAKLTRFRQVLEALDDAAFAGRPEEQSRGALERALKAAEEQFKNYRL